jgi:hypothetical protein
MAQLLAGLDAFESPMEMDSTAQEFGVRLTSVADWAADLIPVAVG